MSQQIINGEWRDTEFDGFTFPILPESPQMMCDQYVASNAIVPLRYVRGVLHTGNTGTDDMCFTYAFLLSGTPDGVKETIASITEFFKPWIADALKQFHVAERVLYSDNPKYAPRTVPSVLYVRFYRNVDFKCHEHPEMLLGEPLGQYHCPKCGVMQVAGMAHMEEV